MRFFSAYNYDEMNKLIRNKSKRGWYEIFHQNSSPLLYFIKLQWKYSFHHLRGLNIVYLSLHFYLFRKHAALCASILFSSTLFLNPSDLYSLILSPTLPFFFFLKYYSRLCSKIAFMRSRLCILALILLCIFSLYSTIPVILRNKDCCVRILRGDETRALYASEPLGRFKSHPMTAFLPYEVFNIYHY